jgi:hypothetical protein
VKNRTEQWNVAWAAPVCWLAPCAWATLTPLSARYEQGGTSRAEGLFVGEVVTDSFGHVEQQPPAPIGPYYDNDVATAYWQDSSFPSLWARGEARSGMDAYFSGADTWFAEGSARAGVAGDYFNGSLGKAHAWTESIMTFSVSAASPFTLDGIVQGRDPSLIDPTWVNFTESASVQLWHGTTLVWSVAGAVPGVQTPFSYSGVLTPGEWRVEARARARTESLAFGQPWLPQGVYQVVLVVPGVPAAVLAVCAAPITLRRRR